MCLAPRGLGTMNAPGGQSSGRDGVPPVLRLAFAIGELPRLAFAIADKTVSVGLGGDGAA